MRKSTIRIREELIAKLWSEKKQDLSMEDIAEIFGISIGNVYRILKKYNKVKGRNNKN